MCHPYKIQWWCAVDLGRRVLLLLFITALPTNTVNTWFKLLPCVYFNPPPSPQSPLILILMMIFTLYAYLMPYKEMLVNLIELAFQLLFLLFLLLRSTSVIVDSYQKFSTSLTEQCSDDSREITDLTWVLFPFAWLPVIACLVIACYFLLHWLSQ